MIQGGQAEEEPLLKAPPKWHDYRTHLLVTFNTIFDFKSLGVCKLYNNTVNETILGEVKHFNQIVVDADPCEVITDLFITCHITGKGEVSSLHFDHDDLPSRCSINPGYVVGGNA